MRQLVIKHESMSDQQVKRFAEHNKNSQRFDIAFFYVDKSIRLFRSPFVVGL